MKLKKPSTEDFMITRCVFKLMKYTSSLQLWLENSCKAMNQKLFAKKEN